MGVAQSEVILSQGPDTHDFSMDTNQIDDKMHEIHHKESSDFVMRGDSSSHNL